MAILYEANVIRTLSVQNDLYIYSDSIPYRYIGIDRKTYFVTMLHSSMFSTFWDAYRF